MDTFTISAAARLCRCDRRTLQRAIHAGRLHLDAQHCLSREDLLAAGYLVFDAPQATPHVLPQSTPHITPHDTPQGTPQDAPLLALLERFASAIAELTQEVRQLHAAPHSTPQSRPHIVPQHRPQDAPHSPPHETPQVTPPPTAAGTAAALAAPPRHLRPPSGRRPHPGLAGGGSQPVADRHPAQCRRRAYPTRAPVARWHGRMVPAPLWPVTAMVRDGLLQRVGRGRYVAL